MKNFFNKHTFGATIFVFLFMWLVSLIPIQSDFIDPIGQAISDFELGDIVFSILKRDSMGKLDDRIVLVNTEYKTRKEVGEMIRVINKCHPKAIGIDHFYRNFKDEDGDTVLSNAFKEVKNLVLVTKVEKYNEYKNVWDTLETSNVIFMQNAQTGFANLISDGDAKHKTCRSFTPVEHMATGEKEFALSVKLANFYNPKTTDEFLKRRKTEEFINFKRTISNGNFAAPNGYFIFRKFDLEGEIYPELFKDKIVLLGFMGSDNNPKDIDDMFFTPMNPQFAGKSFVDMYGVVIHANIISMILDKDYINVVPRWVTNIVAIIICFLNAALFSKIMKNMENWYDALTKLLQLIQTLIVVGLVVYLLYKFNLKIDLTLTTVAIVLVGDLLEIYYAVIVNIFQHRKLIINKINPFKNKFNSIK